MLPSLSGVCASVGFGMMTCKEKLMLIRLGQNSEVKFYCE